MWTVARTWNASRWLAVLGLVALEWPAGAAAQGLSAQGQRDLAFGAVVAGLPASVPRTDQGRVARFRVRGANNAEVLVQFNLPAVLANAGGQTLPITFGPDDGGWSARQNIGTMQGFDPTVSLIQRLSNNGRMFLVLGGTVSPPITSTAGRYTNTITMTVTYTGN